MRLVWIATALSLAAPVAAQEVCLRETPWGPYIAPYGQEMAFELIAQDGDTSVVGIRFSPLQGDYAKVYGFFLHNGDCVVRAMVVGAFASANAFQPVESLPEGAPVRYHQDFYSTTTHATLDVSLQPPAYEDAKALALGLLR